MLTNDFPTVYMGGVPAEVVSATSTLIVALAPLSFVATTVHFTAVSAATGTYITDFTYAANSMYSVDDRLFPRVFHSSILRCCGADYLCTVRSSWQSAQL